MSSLVLLAVAFVLMVACGLFVAAEFAFVGVDRSRVAAEAKAGNAAARGLEKALATLSTQLWGTQLGITASSLVIGWLSEPALASLLEDPFTSAGLPEGAVGPLSAVVGLVVSTVFTMLIGELVPKNIALALPMQTGLAVNGLVRAFTWTVHWPVKALAGLTSTIVRRLGLEPQDELSAARSAEELASLVQHSATEGTLDRDTAELMERSVEFGSRTAGEIMTPRIRQHSLDADDRASDIIELTRRTGHSRFPVLDADDAVVGTVHVKSAVALPVQARASTLVKHLMSPPIAVPDSLRLDPLLELLRAESFQLAVVMDEYGDQAGIVTLEDVVEEIVGDIADEHDTLASRARLRRDGAWVLSGLLRPDEVEGLTGVELPASEHYDTVAGLVMRELGAIATRGDAVELEVPGIDDDPDDDELPPPRRVRLTVEHMDGLRIDRLTLTLVPPAEDAERGEGR